MMVPGQISTSNSVDAAVPAGVKSVSEISVRPLSLAVDNLAGVLGTSHPELALALSRTFNPATDRILWERLGATGQSQSNVSRNDANRSRGITHPQTRPDDGVALGDWFCDVAEGAGLSTALGMAAARRNLGQQHWIVVVTTAHSVFRGLSHEVIEQLQGVKSRLVIVVLDDGHALSVSESFTAELSRRGQFDQLDSRWISELGLPCRELPTARSTIALLAELQQIVQKQGATVLHVRDVPPMPARLSDLPTESQSRGVLRLTNGVSFTVEPHSPLLYAVADELQALSRTDPRVAIIVQDRLRLPFSVGRSPSAGSDVLPAAERARFTRARGLAIGGCRPFIVMNGRYLQQSLDQLSEQLCQSRQPVTLVVEPDDAEPKADEPDSIRNSSDLAFLRLLPETVVAVPRDERELREMLRWSLQQNGPVAVLLPRVSVDEVPQTSGSSSAPIESGRAIVIEEGQDVALIALGSQVDLAVKVAQRLSQHGISAGVVNARFVNPLDRNLLRRVARLYSGVVTLEEDPGHGGFGTTVLEQFAADALPTPVLVTGATETAATTRDELRVGEMRPTELRSSASVEQITEQILSFVDRSLPEAGEFHTREHDHAEWSTPLSFDVSSESLKQERESILAEPLSTDVERWVDAFAKIGRRPKYLWQWCQRGVELTTLPCVPPEWRSDVCDSKVLSIMINVLLDDVADLQQSPALLEELLQITRGHRPDMARLSSQEQEYATFVLSVWTEYWARVSRYPNFPVFGDLLQYDLSQLFNTIRYSNLLNRNPHLLNMVEHDLYSPHSMMQMSFATVDLCCTADFPWDELGKLREAIWHAQCMGRIGNLVTTWQREIPSRDFTSGVFAHAVTTGDLTVGDLLHSEPRQIEAAIQEGGHEVHFLKEWKYHLRRLHALRRRFHAFDLGLVIQGLKKLLVTELASRGHK